MRVKTDLAMLSSLRRARAWKWWTSRPTSRRRGRPAARRRGRGPRRRRPGLPMTSPTSRWLTSAAARPPRRARSDQVSAERRVGVGALEGEGAHAAVDGDRDVPVGPAVVGVGPLEGGEGHALTGPLGELGGHLVGSLPGDPRDGRPTWSGEGVIDEVVLLGVAGAEALGLGVENTSLMSRRILRLSVRRVRPPVPGSTPRSGTSGSATVAFPSSMR